MKYLKQEEPSRAWILDLESDGLQPTVIWVVVVKNLETGEVLSFRDRKDFYRWYDGTYILIGHNAVSYDIPVINRLWDMRISLESVVDTLVLSYLYSPALQDGHSLDAWGKRLGKLKGDFSDWSQYSPAMETYCKQDVEVTYELYKQLTKRMSGLGFSELSCDIEHKIRIIIDEQIRNGVWFDTERAARFLEFLRPEQARLSEEILRLFPKRRTEVARRPFRRTKDGSPHAQYGKDISKYHDVVLNEDESEYVCYDLVPFNLGSPKQRVERLLELGWTPVAFTPKGNPKVDEDALLAFSESSGRPEIKALAEYLVISARITMLSGNPKTDSVGWLGTVQDDHRIHGKVFSCGAASRRMTHNTPNTANVPSAKKAKYGKEFRSFWGVEPDKGLCMVGYDAKGLETECFKHWLNNPAANKILDGDIHTDNAKALSELMGRPVDREWGAKTSWYAWMFGCYPAKLAAILKCSMKEAEQIWEEIYPNRIPGLKKFIESIQYEWKSNKGRLSCIDGGFVVCPSASSALNYKIQPTGAVVMKLSSIILKEQTTLQGVWNRKLLDVHDEGQHAALEKEIYLEGDIKRHPLGDLAVQAIRESGRQLKMNVELDGSYAVGYNWSETH